MRRKNLRKVFSKRFILLGSLVLALIGIDVAIKSLVHHYVFEPIVVWQGFLGIDFYIQYVTNRGGAWGVLASMHKPLLILRIIVIAGLAAYLWLKEISLGKNIFIILVLSGALGNVIDSFVYGHVIDMFHFVFWGRSYGIFNFADAMIFLGGFGLLFATYEKRRISSF